MGLVSTAVKRTCFAENVEGKCGMKRLGIQVTDITVLDVHKKWDGSEKNDCKKGKRLRRNRT